MSAYDMKCRRALISTGKIIGRSGMSERVIAAVAEFDGSYMSAMILAGRLKAIATMAACDDYWSEKVQAGFQQELYPRPADLRPAVAEPVKEAGE